jgi:hypothetical protein
MVMIHLAKILSNQHDRREVSAPVATNAETPPVALRWQKLDIKKPKDLFCVTPNQRIITMKKSFFLASFVLISVLLLSNTSVAVDLGIMTGSEKGTYYQFGLDMMALGKQHGFNLNVYNSTGSVEISMRCTTDQEPRWELFSPMYLPLWSRSSPIPP